MVVLEMPTSLGGGRKTVLVLPSVMAVKVMMVVALTVVTVVVKAAVLLVRLGREEGCSVSRLCSTVICSSILDFLRSCNGAT